METSFSWGIEMVGAAAIVLNLLTGLVVGAVPASYLFYRYSGDVSSVNSYLMKFYNMGLPVVIERLGLAKAVFAFLIDLLKGAAAVLLAAGLWAGFTSAGAGAAVWAVPGVLAGHFYPLWLTWLTAETAPLRGRGSGVMFGALLGVAAGPVFWAPVFPSNAYGLLIAATAAWVLTVSVPRLSGRWGYPSLANVFAAISLLLAVRYFGWPEWMGPFAAVAALVVWRHKENLGRILDGVEPRLDGRRPLPEEEDEVACAFLVHAMEPDDFWQASRFRWLAWLYRSGLIKESGIRRAVRWFRPMKLDEFVQIRTLDGRSVRVYLLVVPLFPDQIVAEPELAVKRARQSVQLATELGARTLGLGAFWSVVGNKGADVQKGFDLPITNGGAYTSGTVAEGVERTLSRLQQQGKDPETLTAAVVGANGVVGFGICRRIVGQTGKLLMVGRTPERLERFRDLLARRHPDTEITATVDYEMLREADLIFSATSAPEAVIFPEHVKPGSILFDVGRPFDVSPEVAERVPGVQVIPGGVVRPPGGFKGHVDLNFGQGLIPACLAETVILALTEAYDRRSLGDRTRSKDIEFLMEAGKTLGFEIADAEDLNNGGS